jgi:hypothetical protein
MVPLWNMQQREGHALYWDGLNTNHPPQQKRALIEYLKTT